MDSFLNVLEQKWDVLVYTLPMNNSAIAKSIDLSSDDACIEQMDVLLDFLVMKTSTRMGNQLIRLFQHHNLNLSLVHETS